MPPKDTNRTWDETYQDEDFVFGTEPNFFLKMEGMPALAGLAAGAKVLCLACGEGRNAVYMAQKGYKVTAVDASSVALEKAQKLAKESGVEIETMCMDLNDFKWEKDAWDCILAIFAHIDPYIQDKMYRAIPFSLKVGGYLIMEGYTPRQLDFKSGGPDTATTTWSKQLLEGYFDKHLSIIKNEEKYRDIQEGKIHSGKSSVVDFIARKPAIGI